MRVCGVLSSLDIGKLVLTFSARLFRVPCHSLSFWAQITTKEDERHCGTTYGPKRHQTLGLPRLPCLPIFFLNLYIPHGPWASNFGLKCTLLFPVSFVKGQRSKSLLWQRENLTYPLKFWKGTFESTNLEVRSHCPFKVWLKLDMPS